MEPIKTFFDNNIEKSMLTICPKKMLSSSDGSICYSVETFKAVFLKDDVDYVDDVDVIALTDDNFYQRSFILPRLQKLNDSIPAGWKLIIDISSEKAMYSDGNWGAFVSYYYPYLIDENGNVKEV